MRRTILVVLTLLLALPALGPVALQAQTGSRYFRETQHNVTGVFLEYWQEHGGLAQQGFPLTETFQEVSETNGQTYTVQYFERAVFELHPENHPPHDVLLSLLGNFLYKRKYPNGAPNQQASADDPRFFPETGKTLGGKFRAYWEANGGLAQQGFPISDEFEEVSELNGQRYRVQYFERAVFELHPENNPPHDVLLSQLGKFELNRRYPNSSNPAAAPAPELVVDPPAPAGTPSPAAGPPCAPPAASGYSACATVSDPAPSRRELVTTTGYLVRDGQPVPGAIMQVTYNYASTTSSCDAITDQRGMASCGLNIGGAKAGFTVRVDVRFRGLGGEDLVRAETSFTPK